MYVRVFFHFTGSGEQVSSAAPMDLPAAQLWEHLVSQLADEDDYVGLIDNADDVLQIMRDLATGHFLVELPVPDERMSYGRIFEAEDLKDLLAALPPRFKPRAFPELEPAPW